jgi:sigma-B regulation protein RsbU (phosphoserine phosphatase)
MKQRRTGRIGGLGSQSARSTLAGGLGGGGAVAAIRRDEVLGGPRDAALGRVAALAARLLDAPLASVTLREQDGTWLGAAYGLDGLTEFASGSGWCSLLTWPDEVLVVSDALADPAVASSPLVTGQPGVRFYAAAPIVTVDGYRLGTVNVMDIRPRSIAAADLAALADLAAIVMEGLEPRLSAAGRCRPNSGGSRPNTRHSPRPNGTGLR